MQGQIWYFTHPEKTEDCNINCTNLPKIVKQNLTEKEIEYLKDFFKCSGQKLQTIKHLNDVV
ncbi:MAG: hypothetical protein V7K92_01710 [Nostoc sp.]|uniref:hypothetical protein n=1 Tax=Nostoc sp. TaxID=1180 RepID=UPI002FF336E3